MAGAVFSLPRALAHGNGVVLPGAKLRFYLSGTSTPSPAYEDVNLSTPFDIPIEADSSGLFPVIYLDNKVEDGYRVELRDSAETLIYQVDDIRVSANASDRYDLVSTAPELVFDEIDTGDTNTRKWRIHVNNEQMLFQLGNAAESVWTTVMQIDRDGTDNVAVTIPKLRASALDVETFTPAWGGFSVDPTGDISYYQIGQLCVLIFGENCTGTSDDDVLSITNLPLTLRPAAGSSPIAAFIPAIDDSGLVLASVSKSGISTLDFWAGTTPSLTGWTNTGTKGFAPGTTLIYTK